MKVWKEIRGWLFSIGIAFVLSLIIGIFVIQPYKVDGHSMDPTLHDKERIYAEKWSHALGSVPDYGDIVIIDSRVDRARSFWDDLKEHPLIALLTGENKQEIFYVKRLIGKPGDKIEIKQGQVYRNGELLNEPYIKEPMRIEPDQEYDVPEGDVFVMGDNRNNSKDSRMIGFIPIDHIMGVKGLK
ncbi:signal peptidase I [Paenibacillus physcomitrellae]|uniref:Signal peptidase I n=1 Tax=Paenibacillus physcomitrellae TaxID=1619311 RepID=A0ABQ1FN97_9BACL|nr:signal peptidase I [Paenibacillus physcomitrellae]GGA23631.1 signal peptidase I [Paenibacillus physcomitrellae]